MFHQRCPVARAGGVVVDGCSIGLGAVSLGGWWKIVQGYAVCMVASFNVACQLYGCTQLIDGIFFNKGIDGYKHSIW